jgi:prevent-host-death family protein
MAKMVDVRKAREQFSKLCDEVAAGEDVVITRRGEAIARLVGVSPTTPRRFGIDEGRFVVPGDFDAPLPD